MARTLKIVLEDLGKYKESRKYKVIKTLNLTEPFIGEELTKEEVDEILENMKITVEIIPQKF